MKNKHTFAFLFFYVSFTFNCGLSAQAQQVSDMVSPNKELNFSPSTTEVFQLTKRHKRVADVTLGFILNGDTSRIIPHKNLKIQRTQKTKTYIEYELTMPQATHRTKVRVFNNALAFRYEGTNRQRVKMNGELSSWKLPEETTVWYFERKNEWKLKSYAGLWEQCSLKELANQSWGAIQGAPLIFRFPSGEYGYLSEAALENYSGLRLKADQQANLLADFTEGKQGFEVPASFQSPWRILFIDKDLNALVNQSVIRSLSPQPDPSLYADTKYIVPGKCAWRWFGRGTGTPEQEREMIEAASALNFTYSLVDDGWKQWPSCWERAKELVAFGKKKGVKLLFWQHSRPLREPSQDYLPMRLFLDSIASIGAAGVKVDFMDSEAKPLIDFEIKLLKECAKRSLVVNFHGCHNPGGESYTYPNELTREGIRGLELNKMREGYIPAYHNAALPFTRFVVGHGDYTPLSFMVPGTTTWAHQLATLVCFTSPLQTIAEDPLLLLNEPQIQSATEWIRQVPTVWDETQVLTQSEIGKLAVLARRKGNDWYIGILNGTKEKQNLSIDLNRFAKPKSAVQAFIDDIEAPKVILPMDGQRPAALKRVPVVPFKCIQPTTNQIQLTLAPEGGAVITIKQGRARMK